MYMYVPGYVKFILRCLSRRNIMRPEKVLFASILGVYAYMDLFIFVCTYICIYVYT